METDLFFFIEACNTSQLSIATRTHFPFSCSRLLLLLLLLLPLLPGPCSQTAEAAAAAQVCQLVAATDGAVCVSLRHAGHAVTRNRNPGGRMGPLGVECDRAAAACVSPTAFERGYAAAPSPPNAPLL